MATVDEITAAQEAAQTAIGEALQTFIEATGMAVESVEIADAAATPPVVKLTVALPSDEEPGDAPADAAKAPAASIEEHFGV